jgi:Ribosomal protein S8
MIKAWLDIINELKIKKLAGKSYFYSKLSKKKKELLKIFIETNLITKLEVKIWNNKPYFKVYINNNINYNLHILSKRSNIKYITKKNMEKLIKKENMIYILSTPNGISSTNNINKVNCTSGILLAGIN